jgi:hypothetical protein
MPSGNAFREGFFEMINGIELVEVSQGRSDNQRACIRHTNCVAFRAMRLHEGLPTLHFRRSFRGTGVGEKGYANERRAYTERIHPFVPLCRCIAHKSFWFLLRGSAIQLRIIKTPDKGNDAGLGEPDPNGPV